MDGKRTKLLAVFEDTTAAEAAARAVRADAGLPASAIRIGDSTDEVAALQSEMREEVDNSVLAPGNIGPFTKEMSKRIVPYTAIGAVVGAALALPLGLIEWVDLSLMTRLVIFALVGAAAGATAGFVIAGGFATGPAVPLGAERGVAMSVVVHDSDLDVVEHALSKQNPIRVDLVTLENAPLATVETEETRRRR